MWHFDWLRESHPIRIPSHFYQVDLLSCVILFILNFIYQNFESAPLLFNPSWKSLMCLIFSKRIQLRICYLLLFLVFITAILKKQVSLCRYQMSGLVKQKVVSIQNTGNIYGLYASFIYLFVYGINFLRKICMFYSLNDVYC